MNLQSILRIISNIYKQIPILMKSKKIISSSVFEIEYLENLTDIEIAQYTFNKERLYNIIDVNFRIPEIAMSDIRILLCMADHYPISILDKETQKFVLCIENISSISGKKEKFWFRISKCQLFSHIPIAIGHCYSWLVTNQILPQTILATPITQVCWDLDDNLITFLGDNSFEFEESKNDKKKEIPDIPMLFNPNSEAS